MSALQSAIDTPQLEGHFAVGFLKASPQNPPLITVDEPKEFRELSYVLYDEAVRAKAAIIRGLNWRRAGGLKPAALFRDIRKLAKLVAQAQRHIDKISAQVEPNMRINVPTVRVGWHNGGPNEVSSVSEIDDIYTHWIEQAEEENASPVRVAFLRQERIRKINELSSNTEACLSGQKANGYWAARVTLVALERALFRAIYVISHTRPKSMDDCEDLLAFLAWQCTTKNRHADELCNGLVAALTRRVLRGVQQFKKSAR